MNLDEFYIWAQNALTSELQDWKREHEWHHNISHYDAKLSCVSNLIQERKSCPSDRDIEVKLIQSKMKAACKLRIKAQALMDDALDLESEYMNLCSHPVYKVIKWYYETFNGNKEYYRQCLQCGLRERGNPHYLPKDVGEDMGEQSLAPEEAKNSLTRLL